MVGIPWIDDGIRKLRAHGGHYGDPQGGKPLTWMINSKQKTKKRQAVCPRRRTAPPGMRKAGRTCCDEYPFASTYQGGTKLPASQRETTWVSPNENNTQGAPITNWRRPTHVMDKDPCYVIARRSDRLNATAPQGHPRAHRALCVEDTTLITTETTLTPETSEYGYPLTVGEDYEWPPEWPYGWRCGPIGKDTAHIITDTDTDTGTFTITVQTHDGPPPPETDPAWSAAEEVSLHATETPPSSTCSAAATSKKPHPKTARSRFLSTVYRRGSGCACTATSMTTSRASATAASTT
ncbi:NucA/NucB deoxyribonuclease domain-containing protein [Streptomyces griseofuscus]|uniref:NucA/NucB deoxyribonuclease domain-containing protein n=1 Tax=Streptomyces griseofuscus TaxID=146922 RepID=UPI00381285D6